MTLPAAILAGGLATRVRPLTEKIPKALMEIEGRPFIDYQLELLRSNGIEEVVLCLGFLGEKVREYVMGGNSHGLRVRYSFDGSRPLGTGGAIKKALPLLGEAFFVLYGDSYLPIDYRSVESAFMQSQKPALMIVFRNDGELDASNVIYVEDDAALGRVALYEKNSPRAGEMRYIDYGLSCCRAAEIAKVDADSFDLADVFTRLSKEGKLAGVEVTERFYEIGSFSGIEDFRGHVKHVKHVKMSPP